MSRIGVALVLVAAASATASAGPYLGIGIGAPADTNTSSPTNEMISAQGNGHSGRLILGWRLWHFSVEATGSQGGLLLNNAAFTDSQLSLQGKYSFPLGNNFELFARGGIQRTWLNTSTPGAFNASGNGWVLGAGFEYRLNLLIAGGSLFVDYEHAETPVTSDSMDKYDVKTGMFMAGVTLSL